MEDGASEGEDVRMWDAADASGRLHPSSFLVIRPTLALRSKLRRLLRWSRFYESAQTSVR